MIGPLPPSLMRWLTISMFVLLPAAAEMRSASAAMVGSRWKLSAPARLSTTWAISSTKPSRPTKARRWLAVSTSVRSLAAHCSRSSSGCIMPLAVHLHAHDFKNPLQFGIGEEAHFHRALSLAIAQLDFGAEPFAQSGFQINDMGVAIGEMRIGRARGRGVRRAPLLQLEHQFLGLADVQVVSEDAFGGQLLFSRRRQPKDDFGMADREAFVAQIILHFRRQLEEAQGIGYHRAAFPDPARHVFLPQMELLDQLGIAERLFEWIEVFALEIFDQRQFQHRGVVRFPDDGRDFLQADQLGRAPAALSGDQFEKATSLAHDERLNNALLFDRISQFLECFRREFLARLKRAGADPLQSQPLNALTVVRGRLHHRRFKRGWTRGR